MNKKDIEYISPTFELYECMVCKTRYKIKVGTSIIDDPKTQILQRVVNFGPLDGYCTSGSLREITNVNS